MAAAAATALRPAGVARLGLPALALVLVGASTLLPFGSGPPTSYAASSTAAGVLQAVAALALVAAGTVAWLDRPHNATGPVAVLMAVAWTAPLWVGWEEGPPFVRSVGLVLAPFLLPLLVHLVLAQPSGRLESAPARVAAVFAYGLTAIVSVGRALVRDPFLDPYCWSNCTDNVFLLRAEQGLAPGLDRFWLRFTVAAALVLLAVSLVRLAATTRAGRAAQVAIAVPAVLAVAAEGAYALALLRDPAEDPEAGSFQAVFLAHATALVCVAAGIGWSVARARRTRGAIAQLAAELGEAPAPGSLRAALARSLGDERLEVAYWLPHRGRYVDAAGRAFAPDPADGRAVTPIVRSGEPVAVVVHDRGLTAARDLEREIGAAARLAVDNERLRAEVLAQLEDVRASRARIVETGDATRRRLERDLHDGAQQRLLALSYELRIAGAAPEATAEVQTALEELRELAHGIYPAVLSEAGLGPALQTLADDAPLPVDLGDVDDSRYAAPVETAAYVVVAEAIADAGTRGATYAAVSARQDGGRLVVEVADDGPPRASAPTHLADRVGALGGLLELEPGRLRAELPCA